MTPELTAYIQSLTTWRALVTAFTLAYEKGKVERSDWTTWCKVWSQRNNTRTRSMTTLAADVFTNDVDRPFIEPV